MTSALKPHLEDVSLSVQEAPAHIAEHPHPEFQSAVWGVSHVFMNIGAGGAGCFTIAPQRFGNSVDNICPVLYAGETLVTPATKDSRGRGRCNWC